MVNTDEKSSQNLDQTTESLATMTITPDSDFVAKKSPGKQLDAVNMKTDKMSITDEKPSGNIDQTTESLASMTITPDSDTAAKKSDENTDEKSENLKQTTESLATMSATPDSETLAKKSTEKQLDVDLPEDSAIQYPISDFNSVPPKKRYMRYIYRDDVDSNLPKTTVFKYKNLLERRFSESGTRLEHNSVPFCNCLAHKYISGDKFYKLPLVKRFTKFLMKCVSHKKLQYIRVIIRRRKFAQVKPQVGLVDN